jgi:hypothetical protein
MVLVFTLLEKWWSRHIEEKDKTCFRGKIFKPSHNFAQQLACCFWGNKLAFLKQMNRSHGCIGAQCGSLLSRNYPRQHLIRYSHDQSLHHCLSQQDWQRHRLHGTLKRDPFHQHPAVHAHDTSIRQRLKRNEVGPPISRRGTNRTPVSRCLLVQVMREGWRHQKTGSQPPITAKAENSN